MYARSTNKYKGSHTFIYQKRPTPAPSVSSLSLSLSVLINSSSSQRPWFIADLYLARDQCSVLSFQSPTPVKFYFPCHCDCVSVSGIKVESNDRHADRCTGVATVPTSLSTFPLFCDPVAWRALHLQEKSSWLQMIMKRLFLHSLTQFDMLDLDVLIH